MILQKKARRPIDEMSQQDPLVRSSSTVLFVTAVVTHGLLPLLQTTGSALSFQHASNLHHDHNI